MGSTRLDRDRGCCRAREWTSLRLDGQLSEIERLLLRRHLARCSSCRTFAEALVATTTLIRETPAERPSRSLAPEYRPARPRRTRHRLALATALLALAATAGGLVGSFLGGNGSGGNPGGPPTDIALLPDGGTLPLPQLPEKPPGENV
jgi:predicted anti-sigma-YlaC factor YlaD